VIDPQINHPGEAWGALSGPAHNGSPATIKLLSLSFKGLSWVRGDLVLGEMLHLAAKMGVFTDSELAWARYQVTWAQGYHLPAPPNDLDREKNSLYFHATVQFAACNPYQHKK